MNSERLSTLIRSFQGLRIGVLGDFGLDAYWYADMTRSAISRETPLPNRPVVREDLAPGSGANVARLLHRIGASPIAFTILGRDWHGSVLRSLLEGEGIDLSGAIEAEGMTTTMFAKVILAAHDLEQEDSRLDFLDPEGPPDGARLELAATLEARFAGLDGLVIPDYEERGVIDAGLRGTLAHLHARHPGTVVAVDSRDRIGEFPGMVRKPNRIEAGRWLLPDREAAGCTVEQLIHRARDEAQQAPLFITLGAEGCAVLDGGHTLHIPAVPLAPPLDPVGAGDAFLAVLGAALAAGASPGDAGYAANLAAAVTVKKLRQTGTVAPEEMLALNDKTGPLE